MKPRRVIVLRLVVGTICAVVALQGATALLSNEPDYFNFFRQPVSAVVALILGAVGVILALLPGSSRLLAKRMPRSARPSSRIHLHTTQGQPGRNDPCHCGSGMKYKNCCLRSDEHRLRHARLSRQSSQLNKDHEVTSGAGMANRGLRGR